MLKKYSIWAKLGVMLFGVCLLLAGASFAPTNILVGSVSSIAGLLLMAISA